MGRVPCCEKDNVKRGQWTPEEDNKLSSYIAQHGTRNWRLIPKNAGLQRCGKSCRLRWTNYLRPDLKHDQFTEAEEQSIVKLHSVVGNRWSLIAAQLPGRTDNDVKNYWNTKLKKKLSGMGIDPVTHKPFSHLMAEIATALAPPQVTHLAEAALGCFKDEMLHVLTKKRNDQHPHLRPPHNHNHNLDNHEAEKIKLGLSRAISDDVTMIPNKPPCNINWGEATPFDHFDAAAFGFRFAQPYDALPWDQTLYTNTNTTSAAGTGTGTGTGTTSSYLKLEPNKHPQNEHGSASASASSALFGSECVLWDLPSDDLMDA